MKSLFIYLLTTTCSTNLLFASCVDSERQPPINFDEIAKNQSLIFHKWWNDLLASYDNRLRPYFNAKPLKIVLGLTLLSISSISEERMEWTVEMYFHEYWMDTRLKYNKSLFGGRNPLTLPQDAHYKLWTPDTSFINAIRCQYPEPGSVSHLALLRAYDDGRMFSAKRYPFDTQVCTLELSSFGFLIIDVVYEWMARPLINVKNITLPGEYSVPQICIVFRRRAGFCFLQLFVPSTAAVAATWISLWLENETQFADIVAIIVAIIFLSYHYNTVMPKVSYVKAMDMYMLACFLFAFLSLTKLAVVKYMRIRLAKRDRDSIFNEELVFLNVPDNHSSRSSGSRRFSTRLPIHDNYWKMMKVFHIGSQIILPLAFIAFAIFYFFVYPYTHEHAGCF